MPKDSQAAAAAPDKSAEKATPDDHAHATGNIIRDVNGGPLFGGVPPAAERPNDKHAAAAQSHGWVLHGGSFRAYSPATTEPLLITRFDYEAALVAQAEFRLHEPACSPYLPKG